ncbi:aromatic ring-hydroxylating oxygenase subunit alpha [Streptomyces sp. NPDC002143]
MTLHSPLVVDDRDHGLFRVHRSAFVSEEIVQLERERIFDRAWLYVGHESEVKKPGDFVTRRVGGRVVIFNRDRQGGVRVLLNTCRHRGAEVCREPQGNSKVFTCFYHGWAYDSTGRLVSVPDGDSYSPDFDRGRLGLHQPRTESYRGFVFTTFAADSPDLVDYLADGRYFFDLVADQSTEGMEILTGTHRYSMQANWKLLMENSVDGYHGLTVHQTYFEMMMNLGTTPPGVDGDRGIGRSIDLGNGHAVAMSPELGSPLMSPEILEESRVRRAALAERLGEDHAYLAANMTRNLTAFPNMVLIDLGWGIQVRTMYPLGPAHTEITGWQLMPADASDAFKRYRISNALSFWGPAGLATPDDVEGLEQCQRGFACNSETPWSDISRGMKKDTPTVVDELQMRTFWREWNARITGEPYEREGEAHDTAYLCQDSASTRTGAQA